MHKSSQVKSSQVKNVIACYENQAKICNENQTHPLTIDWLDPLHSDSKAHV